MNMTAVIVFVVLIAALIAAAAVTGVKKKTVPMIVSIVALAGVIAAAAFVYKPSGSVPVSDDSDQSGVSSVVSDKESSSSDEKASDNSSEENTDHAAESKGASSKEESSKTESKQTSSKAESSKTVSSRTASSNMASSKSEPEKKTSSKAASSNAASHTAASSTGAVSQQTETVTPVKPESSEKTESADSSKLTITELPVSSDGAVTLPFVPFEDVEEKPASSTAPSTPAAPREDGLDENETPILSIEEMLPEDWTDDNSSSQPSLKDGEYTSSFGSVDGSESAEAEVTVVIKNGKITDVKIVPTKKTEEFDEAAKKLRQQIIDEQRADIDPVTGDNVISRAILGAAQDALRSAEQ